MKFSTIGLCAMLLATTVHAQKDMGESKIKTTLETNETKTKGIVVGLVYTNLTKSQLKSKSEKTWSNGVKVSDSRNETQDMHAGLAGINLGYKNYYAWGPLGFDASATVLKGINKSEMPTDVTIYKIQSNVVYPFTNNFSIAGGLSVGYIGGFSGSINSEPGIGGQIGLQADVKNFGVMLGYQATGARYNFNDPSVSGSLDIVLSGMVSQLSYTF